MKAELQKIDACSVVLKSLDCRDPTGHSVASLRFLWKMMLESSGTLAASLTEDSRARQREGDGCNTGESGVDTDRETEDAVFDSGSRGGLNERHWTLYPIFPFPLKNIET